MLSNVRCNYIEADGCIMVNVTADSIIARPGSIIYNIVDDSDFGLELNEGQVRRGRIVRAIGVKPYWLATVRKVVSSYMSVVFHIWLENMRKQFSFKG